MSPSGAGARRRRDPPSTRPRPSGSCRHGVSSSCGWVKRRVAEGRRETGSENWDPAPDFSTFDRDRLARGLKRELADVANVLEARLELVHDEQDRSPAMYTAVYRDVDTAREYLVEVGRDDVTFSVVEG
jgi:hypothetical protein